MAWAGYIAIGNVVSGVFTESTATLYARQGFSFSSANVGRIAGFGPRNIFHSTDPVANYNCLAFYTVPTSGSAVLLYPVNTPFAYGFFHEYIVSPYNILLDMIDQVSGEGLPLDMIGASTIGGFTGIGAGISPTTPSQVFSGGLHPTVFSNGTVTSGSVVIDCGNGPLQTLTNGGAFTLSMSSNDGNCIVRVTNNSSAGTITLSGFSQGSSTGDSLTTTFGSKFDLVMTRIGGNPHLLISALQ